jgi:hypothetical protein
MLRAIARGVPGGYLRSAVEPDWLDWSGRGPAEAISGFCRVDSIHAMLSEFRDNYRGEFSILELGASAGYSFTKMLYAARYLGMEHRVTVHAFDPSADKSLGNERHGRYEHLSNYCTAKYRNFRVHRGELVETMTGAVMESLRRWLPMLVWIDCNRLRSAQKALERLIPYLPDGCVLYFEDSETHDEADRRAGQAYLLERFRRGVFGADIGLLPERRFRVGTQPVYRVSRFDSALRYTPR